MRCTDDEYGPSLRSRILSSDRRGDGRDKMMDESNDLGWGSGGDMRRMFWIFIESCGSSNGSKAHP